MTTTPFEIPDHRLLSAAEETALATRIQAGDASARDALIEHNLKLVLSRAQWFARRSSTPVDDLFQEGCLGLITAATRYDPTRGTRFSTFAVWWIDQAMGRYLDNACLTVRVPIHVQQQHRVYQRYVERLRRVWHREPTFDEVLAAAYDDGAALSAATLRPALTARAGPVSLDQPVQGPDGEGVPFGAFLPSDEDDSEAHALAVLHREDMAALLDTLPARLALIVKRVYGWEDGQCWTLEAIGKDLCLSRERVRQLHVVALRLLRATLARRGEA